MTVPPVNPNVTRSRVVLEVAAEIVAANERLQQAKVLMRRMGSPDWAISLTALSTNEGVIEVARRTADMAIINPSAALTVAYRGKGQWREAQPVRAIGVIPSLDQYVFAVKSRFGLTSFEDIASRRPKLRVSLRGQKDHCLHAMLDHIAAAAGFTLQDMKGWGGDPRLEDQLPWPDSRKIQALMKDEIDAIFDEAAPVWVDLALDAGCTILPLAEATVRKLEAMGYRRAYIRKADYPRLPADVLTIDFSGWTIYVHAALEDEIVRQICAGLDARKHLIPWEQPGPLPVERMCRNEADTPLDVPLHPAAETFWKEKGYI
ncbi:MAG TPA: TAXI family TRAP transporter solute-binding subunit [Stellaceae bacterium]|nr:TAXI family TRAP transporter solute-binding subunit [Stellaceae bacterium]